MAPHSLESADEDTDALARANRELSELIFSGRSFSGRERHCAFLNVGEAGRSGPRFARASAVTGLDLPDDGRAIALSDWDQDGDLDLWISNRNAPRIRFFRNDLPEAKHFLAIRLVGNGKQTNRDAIGARVEVYLHGPDHPPMIRTLRAGEGFLGQSSKWLHFGLGDASRVARVVVRWPAGQVEEFSDLEVDSRYCLVQGSAVAAFSPASERALALEPGAPPEVPSSDASRIPLAYRLPMIRVPYEQLDGLIDWARFNEGKPVLLTLWVSWCDLCIDELQEFAARRDEIRAAGIEVLALSVDGLGDDESTAGAVRRTAASLGLPFEVGRATPQLLDGLEIMHHRQIPMHRDLPLPTSFLVDARGRLAAIYKGPVAVEVLLDDVRSLGGSARERFVETAAFPGRTIDHPKIDLSRRRTETLIRFRLATGFEQAGRFEEAALHYRGVIELSSEYAEAHNNLGNVLDRLGRSAAAEEHLLRALELKPEFAFAHHNLGNALLHQGSSFSALRSYRRAIELAPGEAGFHFSYGNALLATNQPVASAVSALQQAIKLDAQLESAHFLLGIVYERLGRTREAIVCCKRTLAIDPRHVGAQAQLQRLEGSR